MGKPNTARLLELADAGRAASDQFAVARRAAQPIEPALTRFPVHDFGAIVPCPDRSCGGATEDGRNVRDPFVGRACFWCGACWDSDGKGGLARMERTVRATPRWPAYPAAHDCTHQPPCLASGTVTREP